LGFSSLRHVSLGALDSNIGMQHFLTFRNTVRKFFIILVAKDLHLIFPTPSTTAITIRNMHQASNDGSSMPKRKMRVLCIAFVFAVALRVLSQYAVGILWVTFHDILS
jgi:hypothetical protein